MPVLTKPVLQDNKSKFQRIEDENISLHEFVVKYWPVIEQGKPFVDGPHIRALCKFLEAVTDGRILRLIVNMPPRHAKSSIISVLYRVWTWIKRPSIKWLCASYALGLAIRDNVKCRRLILSNEFQAAYGHIFRMQRDQNAKIKFENNKGGYSQAGSVGSGVTGDGGDLLLIDDPHSIDETRSDTTREATLEWFKDTWCTRLNDQQTSAMIVVGQRVHEQDLSGYILGGETGEHWIHLNLATEYHAESKCTVELPDGTFKWSDWRKEEGELLWPERFPLYVIERAKKRHGALAYSALYQQAPVPPGGYVFKKTNERLFTLSPERDVYLLETPGGIQSVLVADCWEITTSDVAAKDKESNDYTVFEHWAVTPDNDVLLLDVWRGHWSIPEQKNKARQIYRKWFTERYRAFYFEDVGYQSAIGQDLLTEGIPVLGFRPKGDKTTRAIGASIWQEAGKVYLLKHATWLEDWQTEIYKFPMTRNDDQVDPFSMICMIIRSPEIDVLDPATAAALQQYIGY